MSRIGVGKLRGFNIGDRLTTKDGKHSGIVTRIEPVIKNGEYDIKISINEGREYKKYTDSIHNFIIF